MTTNINNSSPPIQIGETLSQKIKNTPPLIIKSALLLIKEASTTANGTLSDLKKVTLSENPEVTALVTSILRNNSKFIKEAESAGYNSIEEYAEKELTQALFDQEKVIPNEKDTWLYPMLAHSSPVKNPTENTLRDLIILVDTRLQEVTSVRRATELKWVHGEDERALWPNKIKTWKENFKTFSKQIEENAPRELFSRDTGTREKQYKAFVNQMHEALSSLILTNMDYDFYDTAIPYLLAQCYTAWEERLGELSKMATSDPKRENNFVFYVHRAVKGLLEDVLMNRILDLLA